MKLEEFKDPPVEYRPVPFLSVNDDLDEERLDRLAEEFLDKGWGGLFFHARVGLVTPYMGNRWFNLVKSTVRRLRELGGSFWIYDEQGWPSGQAGGQVTKLYRSKLLLCRPASKGLPTVGTIRTERAHVEGGERLYDFAVKTMPPNWLPDMLDPAAVRAFLESTHELYKIHVGGEFGKTVPGVFTDEPQYATHHSLREETALPWTDRLPDEFRADHGYEIAENLQCLFFDVGDFRKVRYDFFSTVTRLFVQSYTVQIHNWCQSNNLKYTGHYEWEDSLLGQLHCIGSAMQHYEYMQQPGIDHLGRGLHNPWVEKQVASVASQLGKERVLSETYGVAGQSLSFHDRRWIGNWQYALGINFLNHHVAQYGLRGVRKRDYPPTLSPPQPWWEYNRIVADHFARLSYLLSQGRRMVDILVISPIGSAWCEYGPYDYGPVEEISRGFEELTVNLLSRQLDFEYGEEFIMERHGSVQGAVLKVGRSRYRVVLLPPMISLRGSTVRMLRAFTEGGGSVLCVGRRPSMIEGEDSQELRSYMKVMPIVANSGEALEEALRSYKLRNPRISWLSGASRQLLLVHRRQARAQGILFLVNTSYSEAMALEVDFGRRKQVQEFRPLDGRILDCPGRVVLELAAGEGRCFVTGSDAASDGAVPAPPGAAKSEFPIKADWAIKRKQPNQAVLDFARWRNPGGKWSKLMPVWKVHDSISSARGDEFELDYEFETDCSRPVDLVVEDGEKSDIYVNGRRVRVDPESWWLDPGFKRIPIGDHVVAGRNAVTLKGRRDPEIEIEDAYLLGDFAVSVRGRRTPRLCAEEGSTADVSDLRMRGYPFYAGEIVVEGQFEVGEWGEGEPWIEFEDLGGIVARFSLNGSPPEMVFWREYRFPAEKLKRGRNSISIELVNSLRNLLGPRHWRESEFTGVNPNSFRDDHGWTDSYVGVPFGIRGLRVVWR